MPCWRRTLASAAMSDTTKGVWHRKEAEPGNFANGWDAIWGADPVGAVSGVGMPKAYVDRPDGTRLWCSGRVEQSDGVRDVSQDSSDEAGSQEAA